ncbi:MAG: DUF2924 domain-containing protein [Planctomycetaceae bacterium]|nr:DUF2924 domain-containing protein [Planctomycetaceae bacterium]
MLVNVAKELAAMERLKVPALRQKYEEVFGEVCRSNHKTWLIRRIIWRLQANAEGDLSERARRRAEELANDADLRLKAPKEPTAAATPVVAKAPTTPATRHHDDRVPMPGSVITREYKGRTERVTVLAEGFEWAGDAYPSLSAVAKAITGSHTNGFLFFGLTGKGDRT